MKKKLLSLVLAGAMVASTSVSAFATTVTEHVGNGKITGSDDKEYTTDVEITGQVLNDAGNIPPSTFNVTVPTTASFTVGKDNNVISADITIQNNGTQNIDVYADKFIDLTPGKNNKITVVKKADLANSESNNRSFVSLSLAGKTGIVYLKTEDNNNGSQKGVYSDPDFQATGEALKLTTIPKTDTGKVTLNGSAGSTAINDSITDNFTLTLKIKKSTTN